MNKRFQGWAVSQLSIVSRLILINAVLSSIPTYFISVFKIPQWVILEIDKTRRGFLWKSGALQEKGLSLVNWDSISKPKKLGGLGIIDLTIFNDVFLAK